MSVLDKTKILLAYRSGDMCAMPTCERRGRRLSQDSVSGDPVNLGQCAHIKGESGGKKGKQQSARFDPSMTDDERNSFHNLIYLCPACHKLIDTIPQGELDYPSDLLYKIKREHENKVRTTLLEAFSDVDFKELEEATRWVQSISPLPTSFDYTLVKIEDKIKKNEISSENHGTIAMGLSVAPDVAQFIGSITKEEPSYPDRLRAGFLTEYWRLKHEGFVGDDLFDAMCLFAQRGFARQSQRSAGLAVMIYLFELCEVFEK